MLDIMRKHAQSWFIKALLAGVIVTFVFWFGWSGRNERPKDYVAKINDQVITADQYKDMYQEQLEAIRSRSREPLPPEMEQNLRKQVRDGLVHRALLIQEAERLGLSVSDADLAQDIRSNPLFQREGRFDENAYRSFVSGRKMSVPMFEQSRKVELLENLVISLFTDSVKPNPNEIMDFWHFQNDKLSLGYLMLPVGEPQETKPTAEELQKFFRDNSGKYEVPASVEVTFLHISPKEFEKTIEVSEDELRAYYAKNQKEYRSPEKVKLRQIFMKFAEDDAEQKTAVQEKMAKLKEEIKAGRDFGEAAKEVSEDTRSAESGGDMGFISKGAMSPQLEAPVFKLAVGEISDPVLTDFGCHLFKVEEKVDETLLEFDAVRGRINQKIVEPRAKERSADLAQRVYEDAYRAQDLAAPAEALGLQLRRAWATKTSGLPDLPTDPKIMDEAFSLKANRVSKMVRTGDDYVIMKLVDMRNARVPELSEIQSAVERDYAKEQAVQATRAKAADIIRELAAPNADAQAIAAAHGLKWEKIDAVSRSAQFVVPLGGGPAVNEMLTSLSEGASLFHKPLQTSLGVSIVRLDGLERASEERFAKEGSNMEQFVLGWRKREFLRGWLKNLEDKSKIEKDDRYL